MKIVISPNAILRQTAQVVENFDEKLSCLVEQMSKIMIQHKGLGLAAPQIGVSMQIIVFSEKKYMINPQIIASSVDVSTFNEGCLSIPGKIISVERPSKIQTKYYDLLGNVHDEHFSNLEARIIQHEIDHLNGILMIDWAKKK